MQRHQMTPARYLILMALATTAASARAQSLEGRIIYDRATQPNGAVWLNDAMGHDSLLFTNGNLAKLDRSGRYIMYMQGTAVGNEAYGGGFHRYRVADANDALVQGNNDYLVGYDMIQGDSSFVTSYSCGLYHDAFDGTYLSTIQAVDCFDDGPDLRQQDSLIVFHNAQSGLHTVRLDGTGRTSIPGTGITDYWPTWSPDGHWILFGRYSSDNTGYVNFYRVKEDGDSLMPLTLNDPTDTAHYTANAVWNTDGSAIITAGYRDDSSYGLLSITADGTGTTTPIPTAPGDPIRFVSGTTMASVSTGKETVTAPRTIRVWPNPTTGAVHITLPDGQPIARATVFDTQGTVMRVLTFGSDRNTFDLSDLSPGMYSLRCTTGDGRSFSARIVEL